MINIEEVANQTGLERCDLELIAAAFERVAVESMDHLAQAAKEADSALACKALHKLAGSSAGLLGQPTINSTAKAHEEAIKAGEPVDLSSAYQQLAGLLGQIGIRL